jgi:hypothetical protein
MTVASSHKQFLTKAHADHVARPDSDGSRRRLEAYP